MVTQNTYKINHKLNCDNKCLIYLSTCKKCWKKYVGETTDAFRQRSNNYKNNVRRFLRKESCMQQHLFEHFQSPGHTGFVEDVCITFIDKADPFIPTIIDYWRQALKILAAHGVNIEESV